MGSAGGVVAIRVMFMQSQSFFGADSGVHAAMMRHFDRSEVEVHVALTTEETRNPDTSAVRHLAAIADIRVRPTYFGPSLNGESRRTKLARSLQSPAVPMSLLQLAAYVRHNGIQI